MNYGNTSLVPDREALEALVKRRIEASEKATDELWPKPGPDTPRLRKMAQEIIRRNFRSNIAAHGGKVRPVDGRPGPNRYPFGITVDLTGAEAKLLFRLAGFEFLTSDSHGPCTYCIHSFAGKERGYSYPCISCKRPSHTHFQGVEDADPYDIRDLQKKGDL